MSGTFDIAIVGMAGRMPGAEDVDALWQMLVEGREGITFFTDEELLASGVSPAQLADPTYVRAGAVVADVDRFDAGFFGFSPGEATMLDPQHRLFLEHAWHALEDAAHDPAQFDGTVGVFAGCGLSSYFMANVLARPDIIERYGLVQLGLANDKDSLATRVAYALDLRGPCYNIQSYCSTSLVAVCAAATSLVQGECDMALAGGVHISVPHRVGYHHDGAMTSGDGHCRAFDARAGGTPIGSGVGVVVLRRLEDALADRDDVRAVIRGWAVNNDGRQKVGFTAPSARGQSDVIAEAQGAAGVDASAIDYVEAHGTGTALGDAVEIAALQRVFSPGTRCLVGSVKTNLGHLDRAAGVTGLIKTTLALRHEVIPPTLHFTDPNPRFGASDAVVVADRAIPWPRNGRPRLAGVSAFGIGGTNAHVIIEEAPAPRARVRSTRQHHLLVWSGRTEAALGELTVSLHQHLAGTAAGIGDIAYTLQTGRARLGHRRAVVAGSTPDAAVALAAGSVLRPHAEAASDPRAAFVVGGRSPDAGAVARLAATEGAFRDRLDEFRDSAGGMDTQSPAVGDFAVWFALAATLVDWGVEPSVVVGRGGGELVAACLADVLSPADAVAQLAGQTVTRAPREPRLRVVSAESEEWLAEVVQDPDLVVLDIGELASVKDRPADVALTEAVGRLWLRGIAIDWERYHRGHDVRRTPVPRYPFSRERHWIDPPVPAATDATGTSDAAPEARLYRPVWRAAPSTASAVSGHVIVLADDAGVGDMLRDQLAADGVRVTLVRHGEVLGDTDGEWTARPWVVEDLLDIVRIVAADPITAVVDLWPLDASNADEARPLAFLAAAGAVRAMGRSQLDSARFVAVTANAEAVLADDVPTPEGALAIGPCLVAVQEYPTLDAGRVDLPPQTDEPGWVKAGTLAVRAELAPATAEPAVAYRDGQRYVRTFEPEDGDNGVGLQVRGDGAYLIVGGLGTVGSLIALHLARKGAKTLVLTGRSSAGRTTAETQEIEAAGATVVVECVDVTDLRAMEVLVASVRERFGSLAGVIHAAAATAPEAFASLDLVDAQLAELQFAPKLQGVLVLEQVLSDVPVDFCILFSSIAAVLGGIGFAGYVSANAFMDAVVYRNRALGRPWLAVDWDTWKPTVEGLSGTGLGSSQVAHAFSVDEGFALFDAALAVGAPRVVAARGDLAARVREWSGGERTGALTAERQPRPDLPEPFVAPVSPLERDLARLWGETVGIEPVGTADNFFDLGGTSLLGLQLLRRIRRELGTSLPAVALFEAPTVAQLGSHIAGDPLGATDHPTEMSVA
jgi:acyl transferase domain-containing protein